jgi:hypothetical protein
MEFTIFIIIILFIIILLYLLLNNNSQKLDQCFYDKYLFPDLVKIKHYENDITNEIINLNDNWVDWPEKHLYNDKINDWKIDPPLWIRRFG